MAVFNVLITVVLIVIINHGAAYKPAANPHLNIQGANQVHLSLGENDGEVVVTWATPKTASSQVIKKLRHEKIEFKTIKK